MEQKIGVNFLRFDALEKVIGKATYVDDLSLPGMLYGAVLRSPYPHARVTRIDGGRALKMPGVVSVLTHEDVPGSNRIGPSLKDQPLLCDTKVRYVGDAVALVAAASMEACEEALHAIQVDYEELPAVFSPGDALLPEAPLIHPTGNLLREIRLVRGTVDKAVGGEDVVIKNRYKTPFVEHACLEPDGALGFLSEEGRMVIIRATQFLHHDHREVVSVLNLSPSRVRIQQVYMGGGFGSRLEASTSCFVALLVYQTKKPVKMVFSREEVFVGKTKRHPFDIDYTTVATRDGKLKAVKVDILADSGAYAAQSPSVIQKAAIHATGPYNIPNVEITGKAVYTNNPIAGAMRGYGVPQIVFACETQMDIVARELGIDPIDFRLLNCLEEGGILSTGQKLTSRASIKESLLKTKEYIDRHPLPPPVDPDKKRGSGVACAFFGLGRGGKPNPGRAKLRLEEDGTMTLQMSSVEMGTGVSTLMRQIAAEQLGVPTEHILIPHGNTDESPDSGIDSATRVTYIVGNAVKDAARKLHGMIREVAAKQWHVDERRVQIKGSEILCRTPEGEIEEIMSLAEAWSLHQRIHREPAAEGFFDPEVTPLSSLGQGNPYLAYTFGAQAAEVEVDIRTGKVDVLRVIACHDVGKAIHPMNVSGQILGAISMGIGYAILEQLNLRKGRILNKSLSDYPIPTAPDINEMVPIILEFPETTGPFGAKGIGEPAVVPTAPAITNAIYDAVGVRVLELPATLENIMKGLKVG